MKIFQNELITISWVRMRRGWADFCQVRDSSWGACSRASLSFRVGGTARSQNICSSSRALEIKERVRIEIIISVGCRGEKEGDDMMMGRAKRFISLCSQQLYFYIGAWQIVCLQSHIPCQCVCWIANIFAANTDSKWTRLIAAHFFPTPSTAQQIELFPITCRFFSEVVPRDGFFIKLYC